MSIIFFPFLIWQLVLIVLQQKLRLELTVSLNKTTIPKISQDVMNCNTGMVCTMLEAKLLLSGTVQTCEPLERSVHILFSCLAFFIPTLHWAQLSNVTALHCYCISPGWRHSGCYAWLRHWSNDWHAPWAPAFPDISETSWRADEAQPNRPFLGIIWFQPLKLLPLSFLIWPAYPGHLLGGSW